MESAARLKEQIDWMVELEYELEERANTRAEEEINDLVTEPFFIHPVASAKLSTRQSLSWARQDQDSLEKKLAELRRRQSQHRKELQQTKLSLQNIEKQIAANKPILFELKAARKWTKKLIRKRVGKKIQEIHKRRDDYIAEMKLKMKMRLKKLREEHKKLIRQEEPGNAEAEMQEESEDSSSSDDEDSGEAASSEESSDCEDQTEWPHAHEVYLSYTELIRFSIYHEKRPLKIHARAMRQHLDNLKVMVAPPELHDQDAEKIFGLRNRTRLFTEEQLQEKLAQMSSAERDAYEKELELAKNNTKMFREALDEHVSTFVLSEEPSQNKSDNE